MTPVWKRPAPGTVTTVAGSVAPEALGFTLMHEHLYYRFWDVDGRFDVMPSLSAADVGDAIVDEVLHYAAASGGSIVDLTVSSACRA